MNDEYVEVMARLIEALQDEGYPIGGHDSEAAVSYNSMDEMWQLVLCNDDSVDKNTAYDTNNWYQSALRYWDGESATIDGMLGGYGTISRIDLTSSHNFLTRLNRFPSMDDSRCCDVGSGIGRITKGLLLPFGFQQCDMVEASSRQLEAAPEYLGDEYAAQCRFFCCGLQDWLPSSNCYNLIWIQWVICYLTDVDCVRFLRKCATALREGGIICFKENTCHDETAFVLDNDDASLTRSIPYLVNLAKQAGLTMIHMEYQTDFPEELFVVPMIAFEHKAQRRDDKEVQPLDLSIK